MDIFCKIIKGELPSYTCYEDDFVKVIMDINPDVPGHMLVIPKKHYTTLLDMDNEIIQRVNEVAKDFIERMEEKIPELVGARAIVNYGNPQIVKHYHLHLIPVYDEDNIPNKSIEEMHELLKK